MCFSHTPTHGCPHISTSLHPTTISPTTYSILCSYFHQICTWQSTALRPVHSHRCRDSTLEAGRTPAESWPPAHLDVHPDLYTVTARYCRNSRKMTDACAAVWQLSLCGLPDNYIVHTNVHECVCPGAWVQDSGVRSFCLGTACPELCSIGFLICIPHPTLLLSMASPPISCLHQLLQENIQDSHSPLLAATRSTLKR